MFYVGEAKPLCFSLCSRMFDDVEYATFKMIVTQMINYLFAISFQLMFHKTLPYRLPNTIVCFCVISYGQSTHVGIRTRTMMFGEQCLPVSPGLYAFLIAHLR